ncbi:hypothetical protein FMUND_6525 [Fusarium mundagurra]|uniref:Uncharacterized protein n=1 Tax=Fusarium mundagurra TaxID=1567541 RepID=A0A8H5YPT9_9HYPO|nr:hypothetical protein FMUND_6525 [Fusarium mundagurra]
MCTKYMKTCPVCHYKRLIRWSQCDLYTLWLALGQDRASTEPSSAWHSELRLPDIDEVSMDIFTSTTCPNDTCPRVRLKTSEITSFNNSINYVPTQTALRGPRSNREARLIETDDDGLTVISSQCISFAKDRPDDFMNYLRHAWKQDGPAFQKEEDLLKALQKVEVTRPGGETASLVSLYLPVPKLVYLRNRYLLPHESFRLLLAEYEVTPGAELETWTALGDDIGLVHDDDGMFYIDLLAALKSGNESGAVEFPRRVLELYLRIQAACDVKGEDALKQMTSECYVEVPEYLSNVITGPVLLPPPKSWDVSSFELAALEKFYRETLQVDDGSLDAVLKELDKKPDFHHSKQLYGKQLSSQTVSLVNQNAERYSLGDCVWAPKLNCPKNASKSFPELQILFVDVLGMKKTDIGLVYDFIVNFIYSICIFGEPREQKARRLLVALSQDVENYGSYIDKEKILESDIFPVVGRNKHVMLQPASADFYIMDREAFQTEFRGKAGLQGRYLMSNVASIRTELVPGSVTPPYIHPMRAKGLLRLAVHYRSPRTRTADGRNSLARTLGKIRIHNLKDHGLSTILKMKDFEGSQVISPFSEVHLRKNDGGLEIYLEKKSTEAATAVQLPLALARFLMEDPNNDSKSTKPVCGMLPGLISMIFRTKNRNLSSIKTILDEHGIVDVYKLEKSPYIPGNDAGELRKLLAPQKPAQRSRNHGSRPTQDPKVTEVDGQEDDVTQEFGSLSLQGNVDTTGTTWGSDSTK